MAIKLAIFSMSDVLDCTKIALQLANYFIGENEYRVAVVEENKQEKYKEFYITREDQIYELNNVHYIPTGTDYNEENYDIIIKDFGKISILFSFEEKFDKIYFCEKSYTPGIFDMENTLSERNIECDLLLFDASKEDLITYKSYGFACINMGNDKQNICPYEAMSQLELFLRKHGYIPPTSNKNKEYPSFVYKKDIIEQEKQKRSKKQVLRGFFGGKSKNTNVDFFEEQEHEEQEQIVEEVNIIEESNNNESVKEQPYTDNEPHIDNEKKILTSKGFGSINYVVVPEPKDIELTKEEEQEQVKLGREIENLQKKERLIKEKENEEKKQIQLELKKKEEEIKILKSLNEKEKQQQLQVLKETQNLQKELAQKEHSLKEQLQKQKQEHQEELQKTEQHLRKELQKQELEHQQELEKHQQELERTLEKKNSDLQKELKQKESDLQKELKQKESDLQKELKKKESDLQKELKKKEAKINGLLDETLHDKLTGTKNRRGFDIDIDQAKEFFLISFDVNDLKKANDTYGHNKGDVLLTTISTELCKLFGKENVYRIGGDEFNVLIKEQIQKQHINGKLIKLDNVLAKKTQHSKDIVYQVAYGYADSSEGTIGDVITKADERMYENKKQKKIASNQLNPASENSNPKNLEETNITKQDYLNKNVSQKKADRKKSFFGKIFQSKSNIGISGHLSIFVTSLRHSCGTSYVAGSLSSAMTDLYNRDVWIDHKSGDILPDNIMVKEILSEQDRFDAFKNGIVVFDKGLYKDLTQEDKNEMLRADINIMVSTADEVDLKNLASFIKKEGNRADKWLFVFNHVQQAQKSKINTIMRNYNHLILLPHDYSEVPLKIRNEWDDAINYCIAKI